jgi:hypothetical protein
VSQIKTSVLDGPACMERLWLPPEIWHVVLSFLPGWARQSASLVCTAWRRIIWRYLSYCTAFPLDLTPISIRGGLILRPPYDERLRYYATRLAKSNVMHLVSRLEFRIYSHSRVDLDTPDLVRFCICYFVVLSTKSLDFKQNIGLSKVLVVFSYLQSERCALLQRFSCLSSLVIEVPTRPIDPTVYSQFTRLRELSIFFPNYRTLPFPPCFCLDSI